MIVQVKMSESDPKNLIPIGTRIIGRQHLIKKDKQLGIKVAHLGASETLIRAIGGEATVEEAIRSLRPLFEQLSTMATTFGKWLREHEDEIRAWGLWGTVNTGCTEARLYAPMHRGAWLEIAAAARIEEDGRSPDYEAIITSAYGSGGVGFEALRQELLNAPLLCSRQREIDEVLNSLADQRNYVTVCGALPLIEYALSKAVGKWNKPPELLKALKSRLDDNIKNVGNIILEHAAVEMVLEEIPDVWKNGSHQVGANVDVLNRHLALHGTGVGWDHPTNATRAVLLLAASARVADILFKPPADASAAAA